MVYAFALMGSEPAVCVHACLCVLMEFCISSCKRFICNESHFVKYKQIVKLTGIF